MATSVNEVCKKCSPKQTSAITSCHGCRQHFCRKHFNEHRDHLSTDMQNVIDQHDQLKHEIQLKVKNESSSAKNPDVQALLKQIEQWKRDMIARVNKIAVDVSNQVETMFSRKEDYQQLENRLEVIKKELRDQQEMESFIERDIERWTKQLKEIKTDLDTPSTGERNYPKLLIQNVDWPSIIKIMNDDPASGINKHIL